MPQRLESSPSRAHALPDGLRSAVLTTAPGALIAAAPSALRLARASGSGLFTCWVVVAGLLVVLLLVLTLAARAARAVLSAHLSDTGTKLVFGAGVALAVALPVDAVLAAILQVNTHHRALAGATFAAVALGVHIGAWVLSYRLAAVVGAPRPARHAVSGAALRETAAAAGGFTLTLATMAALVLPLQGTPPARERALLLDLGLAVAVVALGSSFNAPRRRRIAAWGGAVLTLGLVSGAAWSLAIDPPLRAQIRAEAPLAGAWARFGE